MTGKPLLIALFPQSRRTHLLLLLIVATVCSVRAQQVYSIGIFTGINLPGTIDQGINKDPRYRTKYAIKALPVGIHYGVDYNKIGFAVDPYVMRTGQNYYLVNTVGGQIGERHINLDYFQLPFTFKLHLIDLSFFKLSFVSSATFGLLLKGEETINHLDGLMYFPQEVYPILPQDYTIDGDAVSVPQIPNTTLLGKSDFNPLMIFGAAGFRSDWDKTETFQLSFDLRLNYGFTDPRSSSYIDKVKQNQALYDIYGNRRELFITFTFGVSKTIQVTSPQAEMKYRRRKTRVWRTPTYMKPRNEKPQKMQ